MEASTLRPILERFRRLVELEGRLKILPEQGKLVLPVPKDAVEVAAAEPVCLADTPGLAPLERAIPAALRVAVPIPRFLHPEPLTGGRGVPEPEVSPVAERGTPEGPVAERGTSEGMEREDY